MFPFFAATAKPASVVRHITFILVIWTVDTCTGQEVKRGLIDRWRNSIGASVHILPNNGGVSPAFGVFYNPQLNIIDRYTDFSLAATLPITLGAHVKTSFLNKTFFYGHLPAVLEANLGHYSTRDFHTDVGLALGSGYAAQITDRGVSSGPVFTVAARTWFVRGSITIRYMFQLIMQGNGYHSHNLTLAVNLGSYFKKLRTMNKISKWQDLN